MKGFARLLILVVGSFLTFEGCLPAYKQMRQQPQQAEQKELSLDVEHFKRTMTVEDDPFEVVATFSTREGTQFVRDAFRYLRSKEDGGDITGIVPLALHSELFLRGFYNKESGKKTYQVYMVMSYRDSGWRSYDRVAFGKPLQSAELSKIGSDVDCSGNYMDGCIYKEHVVFNVPEQEFRQVVSLYDPDGEELWWEFKVKAHSGHSVVLARPLSEIVALLETMDNYAPIPTRGTGSVQWALVQYIASLAS